MVDSISYGWQIQNSLVGLILDLVLVSVKFFLLLQCISFSQRVPLKLPPKQFFSNKVTICSTIKFPFFSQMKTFFPMNSNFGVWILHTWYFYGSISYLYSCFWMNWKYLNVVRISWFVLIDLIFFEPLLADRKLSIV